MVADAGAGAEVPGPGGVAGVGFDRFDGHAGAEGKIGVEGEAEIGGEDRLAAPGDVEEREGRGGGGGEGGGDIGAGGGEGDGRGGLGGLIEVGTGGEEEDLNRRDAEGAEKKSQI